MKPLFLLLTLACPFVARAQFSPPTSAQRPAIAAPQFGLSVLNERGEIQSICPLQRTDVKADIAGNLARVVVVQQFSNPSETPIEALYTFPLPHDAAVDGMTFRVGDRQIVGEIRKREEAAQVYAQAKAQGQNAALLDQERPNIFSQRVANILPGQQIRVEIALTQPVVYRAGRYQWEFPTVVGPRYVTAQTPDAEKITPPITPDGTRAGHDLTMRIHLQSALPLGEISSALHPIVVDKSGELEANIALKEGATLPNKDFVLRFAPRDNALQTGLITRGDGKGGGWFQLVVQPPTAAPAAQIARKEMVFVIDQTGSQMGAPIEKAKETMRYCIQNLNAGDTFQLLGFNTAVYPCFPAPVEATPKNIATALAYLAPLAGGGGTDILKATDYALSIPADPDRPRIVCFMTDGFVGNDASILEYVSAHPGARMFPFGVGNSVNRYLIDGMARAGGGIAEYALLNEDGQKLAQRFYERVANPVLLNVKADWQGLPVAEVYPRVVPDVYESGPVVLTGRFTRGAQGELLVKGRAAGKDWTRRVPVDFSRADEESGAGLPSAWARQKIEDLSVTPPKPELSGESPSDLRAEITKVALDYHLMSPYTSFVAVEPTVVNVGGEQKTVEVPVEMADGVSYEGIFGGRGNHHVFSGGVAILGNVPMIGGLFRSNGAGIAGNAGGGGFGGQGGGFAGGGGFGGAANLPSSIGAVTQIAPVNGMLVQGAPGIPGPQGPVGARTEALESRRMATEARVVAGEIISDGRVLNAEEVAKLEPARRIELFRSAKMSADVATLSAQKPAAKVTVQLWLSPLADEKARAEFAAKLKALGWTQSAVLTPGKLVLGEIASDKLDELAAIEGVRLIEAPKFK